MANLLEAHQAIADVLENLAEFFEPHVKLTFLMRNPESADGDFVVTSDSLEKIEGAIRKLRAKEGNVSDTKSPAEEAPTIDMEFDRELTRRSAFMVKAARSKTKEEKR